MTILPIHGERWRMHVESSNPKNPAYLVDVSENDCVGQCTCPHWCCRLAPRVAAGERVMCKHLVAAREYALDREIREQIETDAAAERGSRA